jgi:NAD(P)-dependent dehydrogenase (short-subunit alcohol dehydrogenase family)
MFEGQRVTITGGSSGAGKALARALLERGARVALLARDGGKLAAAKEELAAAASPDRIVIEPCDVSDAAATAAAFERVERALGGLDVLVTSAGVLTEGRFDECDLHEYRRLMDTKLLRHRARVAGGRAALP